MTPRHLLFTGPFGSGAIDRARDHASQLSAGGARGVLYVVPNGTAKRAVVAELVRRRGAVFGVKVVTLAVLPRELERRAHVASPPDADALFDELVVERAVRRGAEGAFDDATPVRGLTGGMLRTITALARDAVTPESLRAALGARGAAPAGATLLAAAWTELETARRARRTGGRTRARGLADAAALLGRKPELLAGCDVVVLESLPLDAALDRGLVAALVAAAPGTVIAAVEYAPQIADAPATRALARLRGMAQWEAAACPTSHTTLARALGAVFTPALPRSTELRADAAAATLNGSGPPAGGALPRVHILEAAGEVSEVRLAARVVRRHLAAGTPASDVQIVVHSPGRYLEHIAEVFDFVDIPVALPRHRLVAETELGRVLLDLLDLATHPEKAARREATLAVLRAPHLNFAPGQADRVEEVVVTSGAVGIESWDRLDATALGERTYARTLALRQALHRAGAAFASLQRVEGAARVVRALAKELRLTANLYFARRRSARPDGLDDARLRARFERAVRDDNAAWEKIDEALDAVPALLAAAGGRSGTRGLPLAHAWLAVLRRVLETETVSNRASPANAVRVVGSGPGAPQPAAVTIVLGLIEKLFPKQGRQDAFLRDDLRRALREAHDWHLPCSDERLDEEREAFVRAAASARGALYLSCAPTASDGTPRVRSFFIEDLEQALGERIPVERVGVSDLTTRAEDALTPAELLATVSHDVWQHIPATQGRARRQSAAVAAYNALRAARVDLTAVAGKRAPDQTPSFEVSLFEGFPHRTLRLSASQLGQLGQCTYKHFVERVLRPLPLSAPEHDPLDRGSLIHEAIARFAIGHRGWDPTTNGAAIEAVDAWIRERVAAWPPAMAGSARARHAVERTRKRLTDLLGAEREHLTQENRFRPAHAELAFGEELQESGLRDPASTPATFDLDVRAAGEPVTVHLRGSIDRVDVVEREGTRYGVLYDYKTGRDAKRYAKAMLAGDDLQLRLYCLALYHFWGIVPVGALYLGFGDGVRRGAVREDFYDAVGGLGPRHAKRMAADEWTAFLDETPALIAGLVDHLVRLDITPAPRDGDCGFCGLAGICRFDPHAPVVAHA